MPGALGIGIAIAAPIDTTWIAPTKQLAAQSIKDNITELDRRTLATFDGGVYSVGATPFIGATATTKGDMSTFGFGTGYAAAKQACTQKFSGHPGAHMCAADELVRSAALGDSPSVGGWYATGVFAQVVVSASEVDARDCVGWTAATSDMGATWDPTNGPSGVAVCSIGQPILCCD